MNNLTLIATHLSQGTLKAVLVGAPSDISPPAIEITHHGKPLSGLTIEATRDKKGEWNLHLPIPPELLSDGVQTLLFTDPSNGATLGSFTILCGDALDEDIRAEMALLRAELDLLKSAFRRHCRESVR